MWTMDHPTAGSRVRLVAFALAMALMLGHSSHPHAAAREYGRIVVLRPRLGMEAQFEAGYKQHLAARGRIGDGQRMVPLHGPWPKAGVLHSSVVRNQRAARIDTAADLVPFSSLWPPI